MQEYQIGFAKTSNKKILGSMNQLAFEYEVLIEMKEGLENVKVLEMNHQQDYHKGIKYLHPIETLLEVLEAPAQHLFRLLSCHYSSLYSGLH